MRVKAGCFPFLWVAWRTWKAFLLKGKFEAFGNLLLLLPNNIYSISWCCLSGPCPLTLHCKSGFDRSVQTSNQLYGRSVPDASLQIVKRIKERSGNVCAMARAHVQNSYIMSRQCTETQPPAYDAQVMRSMVCCSTGLKLQRRCLFAKADEETLDCVGTLLTSKQYLDSLHNNFYVPSSSTVETDFGKYHSIRQH